MRNRVQRRYKFNPAKSTELSSSLEALEERQEHSHNSRFFKEIPWAEERCSHTIALETASRSVRWLMEVDVKAKKEMISLPHILINS